MPRIKILNRQNHPFTYKIKIYGISIEAILIAAFILIALLMIVVYVNGPSKKEKPARETKMPSTGSTAQQKRVADQGNNKCLSQNYLTR